jgi:hypothetical protein
MPSRLRSALPALGLVLALVTGCGEDAAGDRTPGSPVTRAEADVLAELLHEDFRRGGADFVETAPYADGALLTLTGSIDFTRSVGTAHAMTTYADGRPEESRTLFFTPSQLWFGDVPGLADALTAAGLPPAAHVRRPLATRSAQGTPQLVDVLVQLVLNLSARSGDDPRAFLSGAYTWQGQRSINGHLASVFDLAGGTTVAVSSDGLLLQYVTPLPDQDFRVTITLPEHGPREVQLPADADTVTAAEHPDVAARVGV